MRWSINDICELILIFVLFAQSTKVWACGGLVGDLSCISRVVCKSYAIRYSGRSRLFPITRFSTFYTLFRIRFHKNTLTQALKNDRRTYFFVCNLYNTCILHCMENQIADKCTTWKWITYCFRRMCADNKRQVEGNCENKFKLNTCM